MTGSPSFYRLRRLDIEHADMTELAAASSLLSFSSQGHPPTRYTVTLGCTGLQLTDDGVTYAEHHEFDLLLDDRFPVLPPKIVWRTAVFHPNFKVPDVCTGDIWYPAMSLAELCVSLCDLVQYKSFNIYDPLDTRAAFWLQRLLDEERPELPIDRRPLRDLDFPVQPYRHTGNG